MCVCTVLDSRFPSKPTLHFTAIELKDRMYSFFYSLPYIISSFFVLSFLFPVHILDAMKYTSGGNGYLLTNKIKVHRL